MADIPFSIDGNTIICPKDTQIELGAVDYSYMNGSKVYIGTPIVTYIWDFLPDNYVALVWGVYNTMVSSGSPTDIAGNPIDITIPDYANGGLRMTKAYITRPTGKAGGDGTYNFSIKVYNLHADSMEAAIAAPEGNYMDGTGIIVGANEYPLTGWQW